MDISATLMKQYSESVTPEQRGNNDTIIYGVVSVVDDTATMVRYDGSSVDTPVATTVDVGLNDRVMILLKNHTATIIGNLSSPADKTDIVYGRIREYFTLTNDPEITEDSTSFGILDRDVGLVRVHFSCKFQDYTGRDEPLLRIPESYLPTADIIYEAMVMIGDDSYITGKATLTTDGVISQDISSNCLGISGYLEYVI